jgi:hypothetical protein
MAGGDNLDTSFGTKTTFSGGEMAYLTRAFSSFILQSIRARTGVSHWIRKKTKVMPKAARHTSITFFDRKQWSMRLAPLIPHVQ